ncbi:unnamed protein product [Brachionus calyciflorus]|uniref:Ubiquitin carboxyl-terminal hydrolase 47 n=1 Tax=Brachionus calyciflorus TaxID=104777 RepID=A0A813V8M0_9BILA|nr:unnamed protein product [Brachionus calyciflorus]
MVRIDSTYQSFMKNKSNNDQLELSTLNSINSDESYTCILTDMTDPANSCRRHHINLSSNFTIENLIQEAANRFSYESNSFNLMWKNNNELLNISEIPSTSLADLGLSSNSKNIFEIHEKEGPPKRLKVDDFDYNNSSSSSNYSKDPFYGIEEEWKVPTVIESYSLSRRNASANVMYGPVNNSTSKKKSIQTHDLTKSFGWNSSDAFQQHDVQELYRVMFDALEKKMKKTKQENMINELYQGKIKDYVKCLECNTESAREDVYLDVPLCIRPFGSDKTFESVEEALDAFIQPEILDENNKYFCEKCKQKCKAHKGLKFESFPYILSLQLKRFDFDYRTLSRFKIGSTVSFPEILNVKKYLPDRELENSDTYEYELFSIMIHSGSASGGHYYAYIKSFENNQWYNFNDEKVSRIDNNDIIKAFGTSFSVYSSTTAYMLQYRQINPKRNEKFIKVDEFDEHLKNILNKEINEQIEVERFREYMENMCKIKVILADNEKIEKCVDVHKDLTIADAKQQLIKEFNLENYLKENKKKLRILKYDSYNDMIERSYRDENLSVFEALGYAKNPFNVNWYLEIIPEDEEFVEYNPNDITIKIFSLNMDLFETCELFTIRLSSDSTVRKLRDLISEKLNCDPNKIRMALEKMHTLYNYLNLNKNLDDCVQDVNFTRVNKVFVEYQDELDCQKNFESSKFYYSLDTLMNFSTISVYLPSDEQCEIFVKKSKRHAEYVKFKRSESRGLMCEDNATIDSCDTIVSEQTLSSIIAESTSTDQQHSPVKQDEKKIEFVDYYFKEDSKKNIEMETSLDEGIGGSDGSLSTNQHYSKSSPTDVNWYDLKIRPVLDNGLSGIKDDDEENGLDTGDDLGDLDVNVDDNEINNLDDDLDNLEENNEFNNESVSIINSENIMDYKPRNRVKFEDDDLNKKISSDVEVNYMMSNVNEELLNDVKQELDNLPKYSELEKDEFNSSENKREFMRVLSRTERYIKSVLNENKDLGIKILEVKMDKRISLTEFKSHIDEYLKLGLDNFRVFRISPDDIECELTSNDSQFLYNIQNNKYLIKLGPPLKYGEHILPIFKLNRETKKNNGSFTYLCDFMLYNGLNIQHHKELLREDLRDVCDLDVSVDTMRLRKKIGKRPGNILLNHEIIGSDIFINSSSDLCVEILDEPDKKTTKDHTSIYLRHWKPDEYELGDLEEVTLEGNSFELIIDYISRKSSIQKENLEVFKCLREFPFKSPVLDLHRNQSWKEDSYLSMEKLEDGTCFFYRNKTIRLAELSSEKRKELEKEDSLMTRPAPTYTQNRKEIGIKIHVDNS